MTADSNKINKKPFLDSRNETGPSNDAPWCDETILSADETAMAVETDQAELAILHD